MTEKNNDSSQEVDLSKISLKVNGLFSRLIISGFSFLRLLKQKKWIFFALLILGGGFGFYIDHTSKIYNQKIIVTPNFGSVDYMYNNLKLLNSKLNEKDTVFLNSIGLKNTSKIVSIEVDPIIDVYSFINNSRNGTNYAQNPPNFELLKLFSESGDINKVVKDPVTSKNYSFHEIIITTTSKMDRKDFIDPIFNYLNSSSYFKAIQNVHLKNLRIKMSKNDTIVSQIDGLLNSFTSKLSSGKPNDKLVYYNENTQLNDVIKTKEQLIAEQGGIRMELVNYDKIVKEVNCTLNGLSTKGINGKMKLIIPLFLVFIYSFYLIFIAFIRKYQNTAF